MIRFINRISSNYTKVPNALIQSKDIPFVAIGLYSYIASRGGKWEVKIKDLQNQGGVGRDQVYKVLSILEGNGYLKRIQKSDENGKFVERIYELYDSPLTGSTETAQMYSEPLTGLPDVGNTDTYIRKEVIKDKKRKKSPPTFVEGHPYLIFAKEFYETQSKISRGCEHKDYKTKQKETLDKGAKGISELIRLDGYTLVEVQHTLRWVLKHEFWRSHIISLAGMRTKSRGSDVSHFANAFAQSKVRTKGQIELEAIAKKDESIKLQNIKQQQEQKALTDNAVDEVPDLLGDYKGRSAKDIRLIKEKKQDA